MGETTTGRAQRLLAGPRGRRFLLEYALASEIYYSQHPADESFGPAVFAASYRFEPDQMKPAAYTDWGTTDPELPDITVEEVCGRLLALQLLEPTPELLHTILATTVDSATYWQEPEGLDGLAATTELRSGLQYVANHVCKSSYTAWWDTPVDLQTQYVVQWDGVPPKVVPQNIPTALLEAHHRERVEELEAEAERDPDPTANWGGHWGSHPSVMIPSSTRTLENGSPAGLWFVEDGLGWEQADSSRLTAPEHVSVFEIQDATDWAELCARFPLEVTAQKRHDWYRTTGRAGRWVIPDWLQVAQHYDGVHLQVGAYLAAADTAIPVNPSSGTASVIAGWDPDETYWFTSKIVYSAEQTHWVLKEHGPNTAGLPTSRHTWQPTHHTGGGNTTG